MGAEERFGLDGLQAVVESFAQTHLWSYAEDISAGDWSFSKKEINDAVWGTISLTPVEIAVLDSPLVQRLRYVRQLGVVHWVYPGAVHTRFEHTIGVLHQVQHLISSINTLAIQRGTQEVIDANHQQLLRICALLHDVGHAAFSHVSEIALESLPNISQIGSEFARKYRVEERKLSEIVAFLIIRSTAMARLMDALLQKAGSFISFEKEASANRVSIIERLSLCVIGQKVDDRVPLLHELISGPFDADKLDYFFRDAKLAGTPSVLDISRLVQKISIKELSADELPDDIAKNVRKIKGKYVLTGIKWSGVPVLDELHLARILLYAKIYRHPKVTAIEQMLKSAITTMAGLSGTSRLVSCLYGVADDELLAMGEEELRVALGLAGASLVPEQDEAVAEVTRMLSAVRARRLFVKAFEIERRYPADPNEQDTSQKDGLTDFREEMEHPQSREALREDLVKEVRSILALLGVSPLPTLVRLRASIMIHTLGQTPGGSQIARAYLLPASGAPLPFRDYIVNRTAWVDGYMSDQPAGYIFSPPEFADAVYLGVEKLIRERHGVRLPSSALEASKRGEEKIQTLKRKLSRADYYRGSPFDIRPMPERLGNVDVAKIVDKFVERLSKYQEPQLETAPVRAIPLNERVVNWLKQFDDDEFVDCALKTLSKFKMIDRSDTVAAIKSFVRKNPEFKGAAVVPFGNARDSGAVQAYFSADLMGDVISETTTIEELAKKRSEKKIIIVDDFVGSGGQGQDIIAAGFGLSDLRKDLDEQRELFESEVQEHLRRSKIAFVFVAAWDDGVSAIETIAKKAGLDAKVFRHFDEAAIPFAFEGALDGVDSKVLADFKARCEEIGGGLIRSHLEQDLTATPEEKARKVAQRSLGYGNRAMLLASPFNVPTQTMTLFWASGKVEGALWSALMARRKKT